VKAEDVWAGAERNYPSGEPKENREKKEMSVQVQERRRAARVEGWGNGRYCAPVQNFKLSS